LPQETRHETRVQIALPVCCCVRHCIVRTCGGKTFTRDAEYNRDLFAKAGKLSMPILAIGGDHSYGAAMKTELDSVATHVDSAVITNSGHWIMEEQTKQAVDVIVAYLERK